MKSRRLTAFVSLFAVVAMFVATDASDSEAKTIKAAGISTDVPNGWQQWRADPNQLALFTKNWFVDENCSSKSDYTTSTISVGHDPGFGHRRYRDRSTSTTLRGPACRRARTTPT